MTYMEAVSRADLLKPNGYGEEVKLRWLSVLEGMVKAEIVDTHEGAEDTRPEGELLVPSPYDDMYIHWLEAWIDYANGEYDKYNNSMATFRAVYEAYEKHYRRGHKPIGKGFAHF